MEKKRVMVLDPKKVWSVYLVNPDVNHNSWGIAFSTDPRHAGRQKYELVGEVNYERTSCWALLGHFMQFDRTAFHQGGSHFNDEPCGEWHYVEFFGMGTYTEKGLELLDFLERSVEVLNR